MGHYDQEASPRHKDSFRRPMSGLDRPFSAMSDQMSTTDYDRISSAGSRAAWSGAKKTPEYEFPTDDVELVERSNRGCWASFAGCVGGMWATRQMTRKENREVYVRTTLRELVVYSIFLVILCVLTFGMASPTMYYYTKVLNDLFLDTPFPDTKNTFRGSTQQLDFWRYVENVLPDALYWEYWYNPLRTPTEEEDRNILYENRLLGIPRMRQLRIRNGSCVVPQDFRRTIISCYSPYEEKQEEKEPFGLMNGTAWTYHTQKELGGIGHWGKLATYSGAGYYVDLGVTKKETVDILAELKENLWIDRATRAVFIDFTVYNANINLFCVVKLSIEFPAVGGIIPSWSFRTVKLLRYVTQFDHFVLACEIVFAVFVLYYIIEELLEIATLKCKYFRSVWNILDIVVILISLLCIAYNVYNMLTIGSTLDELLEHPDEHPNFAFLGFWQIQFNSLVAVCVFCAWFKLFKYISFNKTMTQLFTTLSRCAKDVAGFGIMFFIVFFAFAQLGFLLFGTQVRDFSSFINAVFTLLRTILGDFNFQEIEAANRVLGPIYFLTYVFFVFFVLLNMFLAIINDTYTEVKAEIARQRNEFELADYFKRGYNNLLGKLGRRDKLIDIQNVVKLTDRNRDGTMTFEEIRKSLKTCNFSDMEIEMFFARYDIDGDRKLTEDEIQIMLSDIDGRKRALDSKSNRPAVPVVMQGSRPPSAASTVTAGSQEEVQATVTGKLKICK